MTTVYFDLETSGLKEEHEIIQLGAIAVDRDWHQIGEFSRKLLFSVERADPEALQINHYDSMLWTKEARLPESVVVEFGLWLGRFKGIQMISRQIGLPYLVARLAAFGAHFDGPRIKKLFSDHHRFLPAHPAIKCVYDRALWIMDEAGMTADGGSMKLESLCKLFNVLPASNNGEQAHDALYDVRMTVALSKRLSELEKSSGSNRVQSRLDRIGTGMESH